MGTSNQFFPDANKAIISIVKLGNIYEGKKRVIISGEVLTSCLSGGGE